MIAPRAIAAEAVRRLLAVRGRRGPVAVLGRGRAAMLGLVATFLWSLVIASCAFAAAGGGTAGFGGGDEGAGGGGGFGGGGFAGGDGSGGSGAGAGDLGAALIAIGIVVALIFLVPPLLRMLRGSSGAYSARQAARREHRIKRAAQEAALDDPAFAPEAVRSEASKLFVAVQDAWDKRDKHRLQQLVGRELWEEWRRRLNDFERRGQHNRVLPVSDPVVRYVGLHNAAEDAEDRVVVRIDARIRDYVVARTGHYLNREGNGSEVVRLREYWTLAKRPGPPRASLPRWILVSIEQEREGAHALHDGVVATPWDDEARTRDAATFELASADAIAGDRVAELADLEFAGDARAAALDLSLADGRFAPAVLEAAVRRVVAAWAQAVDGDRSGLRAIASPAAVRDLLHPGGGHGNARLVVRGPEIRRIRISSLRPHTVPVTMTIEVNLRGVRYVEDRDTTAVLAGSRSQATSFTERWTLGLDDDPEHPWRIVAVDAGESKARSERAAS
jgi:predicted lipid-binding transport protein (Tim44 family)